MNCESGVLSLMTTAYVPLALIEAMLLSAPDEADPVHRLVLAAGGEAVDDVGRREPLAVRPLWRSERGSASASCCRCVHFQLRASHGMRLATACRRDDQRLVEGALGDRVARQPATGVRVEVLGEGRIAGSGHDEALVALRG